MFLGVGQMFSFTGVQKLNQKKTKTTNREKRKMKSQFMFRRPKNRIVFILS